MEINVFKSQILSLGGSEIIQFIRDQRQEVKLLFINASAMEDAQQEMRQILNYLTQLQLVLEVKESEEIQFLYLELGLYFKMQNNVGAVSNCFNKIGDNVLKFRLRAWLNYQEYSVAASHIKKLHNYLATLLLAINDGEDNYENEVIRDLHTYIEDAQYNLKLYGTGELAAEFLSLIQSEELAEQFPILSFYKENQAQFDIEVEINPYVAKIFEPTEFSQQLFDDKFTKYIKGHEKTQWYHILLGISYPDVREKIIGTGQTDFDKKVEGLAGLDIVKLYAHCNMRMHFFTSVYLFERLDAFITLYKSSGRVKFVDIGCGPATAGLSFIEHIHSITNQTVDFDYIGVDYYQNMLDGAAYFLDNPVFKPVQAPVFIKKLSELDFRYLDNANSILINTSYLFASENLDAHELAKDVMNVRKSQPNAPCYLLFQNSIKDENNLKYKEFKEAIGSYEKIHWGKPTVHYSTQRKSWYGTSVPVYLEILQIH
ncbi:hypothetical protein [Pedobacter hiemivivus]|uniref:Uncharacterized protein n=1 Tax=Pedobacter hiemivivus TaxID=2530454 RepID=A0A4R0NHD4_9SPHI|nr:hypothetical protein [Pedobacter hiemivivus]TCC99167.1 hypothetical protein EZ444_00335 [Pedobacter hiemivivus]